MLHIRGRARQSRTLEAGFRAPRLRVLMGGALAFACIDSAQAAPLHVPATADTPVIDGRLDEAAWQQAAALGALVQVSPQSGAAASVPTEIRVVQDGATLYVGVIAHEPPGYVRSARQTRRDAELYGDDHLAIALDPAGGGRNGYVFRVNAIGAQADALIYDSGTERQDWDAIWDVRTVDTSSGWSAEIAIPLSALSSADAGTWGFNVERYLATTGERLRWNGTLPDRAISSLRDAGHLDGMPANVAGHGLRLKPSLRLAQRKTGNDRDAELEPGLDVFWRFRPDSTATVTLNTDFAESEADERQVNLTRFPLFFPEKREFFLQDAGVFAFGGLYSDALPFFSRRVGLAPDGTPLSLDAGAKLTHESRAVEAGLLAARVADAGDIDATTVGVARVAARAGQHGRLGAIGTVGNPEGSDGSRLWGVDWQYRNPQFLPDRALGIDAWTQSSRNTDTGAGRASGVKFDWDNVGWVGNLVLERFDTDYAPALGFVQETGIERAQGELGYWVRTAAGGDVIPQLDFEFKRGTDDEREYQVLNPEVYWGNARGDYVMPELYFERETLIEDFEILPGLVIPAGTYDAQSAIVFMGLGAHNVVSGEASLRFGEFYGGQREDYAVDGSLRPSSLWGISLRGEHTHLDLPAGSARVNVVSLGFDLTPSPRLAFSTLSQWDDVSEEVGVNLRLRWTVAPGRDVYVSLNRLFQRDDGFSTTAQDDSLKVAWNWQW